jgi:putative membrane protein
MNVIIKLLLNALAVFILAYFLPGVTLSGDKFVTAIIVAIVLSVLNMLVKFNQKIKVH